MPWKEQPTAGFLQPSHLVVASGAAAHCPLFCAAVVVAAHHLLLADAHIPAVCHPAACPAERFAASDSLAAVVMSDPWAVAAQTQLELLSCVPSPCHVRQGPYLCYNVAVTPAEAMHKE